MTEGSEAQGAALTDKLVRIRKGLNDFTASTEVEFLDIGKGLQVFHQRSGDLSRRASAIVNLMHGEEITGTIEGLQNLLRRIGVYTETLENESTDANERLLDVLQKLDSVEESVFGFRKIVKNMTVLGLSTKIENARNVADEEGFNILANDLVQLANNIDQQARQVQEKLENLENFVGKAVDNIKSLKNKQGQRTRRLLSDTLDRVALLAEENQLSSQNTEEIALLINSIADKIGNVVSSIQSHDLTRQQIEHVATALQDLESRVGEKIQDGITHGELDRMAGEVCRLQVAQLEHSRDQLLSAVQNMEESLREIAVSGLTMAEQTVKIAGTTNEAGFSFLAAMQQETALISEALNENAEANKKSAATLTELSRSVAQMDDFLQEIERIGGEMKVLALNAGIKAGRTRDGGAGLSVIAEAIQKLSGNALRATTTMAGMLREITGSAQKLGSEEGSDLELQTTRINEFIKEVGTLLQSLQGLKENIVTNLTGIGEEGRNLAEDIDLVASGVSIREKTIRVFGSILENIRELSAPEAIHGTTGRDTGVYGDLMGRYTMRSEREVHRSVIGESTGLVHWEADEGERDTEFGDNVELF
ncbi:MAG: hypothetical protein R6V08_04750 [Desulfuromonadales bacterium]